MSLQQILVATGGGAAPFVPIGFISALAESTPTGLPFTTGAIDTTGADLLVLFQGNTVSGTDAAPTDSKSNTWLPLTLYTPAEKGQFFYAKSPNVGVGHTFNCNTDSYPGIAVIALNQILATSPFDQENGTGGTAATAQGGSVTPGQDNEIVIAAIVGNSAGGTPYAIDSGFTLAAAAGAVGGFGAAIAYKVQTTAAAVNPTWTLSGSVVFVAANATFKHS